MNVVIGELEKYLKENGAAYEVIPHRETFTAQETAEAGKLPGGSFIKVVMVKAEERDYMAGIPAGTMLDPAKARASLGCHYFRIAAEDEFDHLFPGCETGAMPPFGVLYDMPLYLDESFRTKEKVSFNAGTHQTAVRMPLGDFLKLARPVFCPLAAAAGEEKKGGSEGGLKNGDSRRFATYGEQDRHFFSK